MKNFVTSRLAIAVISSAIFSLNAAAQTNSTLSSGSGEFSLEDNFKPGFREFSLGTGPMFPVIVNFERPRVEYVTAFGQVGYMLNHVGGSGIWRGNVELALEAFGSAIWESTGNYIAGGTLYTRYNFVPQESRFAPYVQLGIGVESMDIDHQYDGHNLNFNVCLAGGVRYFLSPRFSLNAEFRYQHFSNADTGDRNIGLNNVGPIFGVSWFF
jgi:opacity protein-like surface antigen